MSSKHTPTPWSVVIDTDSDGHPTGFARVFPQDAHWSDEYFNVEDAERIVACVNACEGLADPSVVPIMLVALKAVLACETHHDERGHAYLKVPARSLADLGAEIAVVVAAAEGTEREV